MRDLRGLLDVPVEADEPYKCETFFARLLLVRPEAPPVRPAGQSGPAPPPPWFGLALAAAHEEIEHDIVTDYWKNFLFSAMLAAAAGCGMLAFAVVMTGSLRRMTAYAERTSPPEATPRLNFPILAAGTKSAPWPGHSAAWSSRFGSAPARPARKRGSHSHHFEHRRGRNRHDRPARSTGILQPGGRTHLRLSGRRSSWRAFSQAPVPRATG